tara:strand:+ start:262 stop:696 length:435 start_codon:yes stop_codon:yes gene_type:complete
MENQTFEKYLPFFCYGCVCIEKGWNTTLIGYVVSPKIEKQWARIAIFGEDEILNGRLEGCIILNNKVAQERITHIGYTVIERIRSEDGQEFNATSGCIFTWTVDDVKTMHITLLIKFAITKCWKFEQEFLKPLILDKKVENYIF